jgi:membrane protease YdiL (CAAX protease family)
MAEVTKEAIHAITEHARKITEGSYQNVDDLMQYTDETRNPPEISGLAEAFGIMSVKVEAREFALQQKNAELEESLKLRMLASSLLLLFSLSISFFIFVLAFFYEPGSMDPIKPALIRWFGIVFVLSQIILMTLLIRKSGFPLSAYGLTWHNARKSVKESLIASAVVIAGLILLKIWMIHSDTMLKGKSLIATEEFETLFLYLFCISAPLQEFLIRGVLQSSAERIIMGKYNVFLAILTISMIFGALHTVYSFPFALLTFATSLLWGWLYARHHNIIGVSICHLLMGLAFILLGFWEIIAF